LHVTLFERISRAQHVLPVTLTVVAFLLASLGQYYLNRRVDEEWAVALFVLAIALTLVAFLQLPEEKEKVELPASRWNRRGTLALLISALPACIASALLMLNWNNLPRAVLLYVLSLGAAAYVCYRWEGWTLPRLTVPKEHWRELVLVTLILACGLFLRLYRLDYYPPPGSISWNDEAQMGKDAYGIIHHGYLPWQFPTSVYATFLSFQVLGPTVLALRLPFVLLGFLTLILFYLLARELFPFPVALAATFLFAVSRWHIAFVRLVLPSTPAMLLEVATFYLLLRGRRTGGMMNYILAGLTMGLGLYSHASFRIVPLLVLLLFIGQAWTSWCSGGRGWREGLRAVGGGCSGWLPFLVSTILFIAPFVAIVQREPYRAFGERFAAVAPALFAPDRATHLESVLRHAQRALGFFNYVGEAWGAVNLPDLPMLDPWSGVLFALGLGYCVFYFWRSRHPFFLAWFFITVIGGGVLTIDFRSHRFAGVMPVLFIFAGVFIERAWAAFRRAVGPSKQGYFALILLPVLLLAAHANYYIFFYRQIDEPSVRIEFTRDVSAIANYMASLGEGHYFYLFANHGYYSTGMDFAWMAGEPPGERGLDILDAIPSHRETGDEELVYIFSTPYNVEALTHVVKYFYPEALIKTFQGEYDRYTFIAAHVGAEEATAAQGLTGRYYKGYQRSGEPDLVQQDARLSFDWQRKEPPLPFPFSVEWEGTVYAPEWGTYAFESEAIGQTQVYVDEQALGNGEEITLVKGWHTLRVVYESEEDEGSLRLLWVAPDRGREVVPPGFLSPRTEVNGLLVTHFEGPDWTGQPVERSIQPMISLLGMPTAWQSALIPELVGEPYSLDCRGQLKVEQDGSHRFEMEPWNGVATLYIDGEEVLTVAETGTISGTGEARLSPGWHDLQLNYSYHGEEFSGVQLFWTQPGGYTRIIPPTSLRPPSSP
jgi:heme/copper-type cytochrome/quinol oxidase subunit 4